jgi:hypothetical protein
MKLANKKYLMNKGVAAEDIDDFIDVHKLFTSLNPEGAYLLLQALAICVASTNPDEAKELRDCSVQFAQ